jgi:hypothetical protein
MLSPLWVWAVSAEVGVWRLQEQEHRLGTHMVERGAAVAQALQLEPGFLELDARDGSARDELLVAGEPALRDRNLLDLPGSAIPFP